MNNEDNNFEHKKSYNSIATDKISFKHVRQNLLRIWLDLKEKPLKLITVSSGILILLYLVFPITKPRQHQIEREEKFENENSSSMHGVKEAVDPRDAWVSRIEKKNR